MSGRDSADNIWPPPVCPPGYHEKDRLENTLHDMVCSGQLDLRTAQQAIRTDWYAGYQHYVVGH